MAANAHAQNRLDEEEINLDVRFRINLSQNSTAGTRQFSFGDLLVWLVLAALICIFLWLLASCTPSFASAASSPLACSVCECPYGEFLNCSGLRYGGHLARFFRTVDVEGADFSFSKGIRLSFWNCAKFPSLTFLDVRGTGYFCSDFKKIPCFQKVRTENSGR